MAPSYWEMQAGDPSVFAFRISFLRNPHGEADPATLEERASWGSFAVWANGENLCEHFQQGETVSSAHWYMLPLIEWFAKHWDPLFHEERFKKANVGLSAAELMRRTQSPPITLKEVDEFDWLSAWAGWWKRHNIRGGRDGGIFPDLYLRRYRDFLEISTGQERPHSVPDDCFFLATRRNFNVDLLQASESIFTVLQAAVDYLRARNTESVRLQELSNRLISIKDSSRHPARMAWLAGLEGDVEAYKTIENEVDGVLSSADEEVRNALSDQRRITPLVVDGSAYARLLYGAKSPCTSPKDVVLMTRLLMENYTRDATEWIRTLNAMLESLSPTLGTPGEEGSILGEEACEKFASEKQGSVDLDALFAKLDIAVTDVEFDDQELRAISVFGPTQRPHIYLNGRSRWSQSNGAKRFTLVHELCHLILDREYGDELAVASGPWAPVAIEQRANAFAAAFLMPTWLLRDMISSLNAPLNSSEAIRTLSHRMRVSASSLIDRLLNLGELSFDDRISLREGFAP